MKKLISLSFVFVLTFMVTSNVINLGASAATDTYQTATGVSGNWHSRSLLNSNDVSRVGSQHWGPNASTFDIRIARDDTNQNIYQKEEMIGNAGVIDSGNVSSPAHTYIKCNIYTASVNHDPYCYE